MKFCSDSCSCLLSLDQAWECRCTRSTDAVISSKCCHAKNDSTHWLDEIETSD